MKTKFVFVTGGVASGLGKGIISASLAMLLQARGLKVTLQKFDPYINIDPGTLNPYEHGECYVTEDGTEADLDLGHYERFTSIETTKFSTLTTGQAYHSVIENERRGKYLGKTVQVVPHITDEIKRRITHFKDSDVVIVEIGGTVGDIEGLPFIESVRQMKYEYENSVVIHLTLVPFLKCSNELKTKPTQHSVKQLLQNGIQPDILVLRTEMHLSDDIKKKCGLFCNVSFKNVIESCDLPSTYKVPLMLKDQYFDEVVMNKLHIPITQPLELKNWISFVEKIEKPSKKVKIALVGKYVELPDAYKSITEALIHAGASNDAKVELVLMQSDGIDIKSLEEMSGVLVAPGFGERGFEGKIQAVKYAREKNVPFFGICLGMQCCVVEFARSVLGFKDANSTEIDPNTEHPVIDIMEDQKKITNKGGTMRLGSYECTLTNGSKSADAYRMENITERHRHRYEFNNKYQEAFTVEGMKMAGVNSSTELVEIVEIPSHPWFVGVQFHPEFKSTVAHPHPLFCAFVKAALTFESQRKSLFDEKNRSQPHILASLAYKERLE